MLRAAVGIPRLGRALWGEGGATQSAHCLDPTPVLKEAGALCGWSLVSPCQVKVREHLFLSGPLVAVLGRLLVRCPLR